MLEPQAVEGSALVTCNASTQERGKVDASRSTWRDNRHSLWCTYCKKPRHTKERCWKLNGKPVTSSREWGNKGQPRPQAHLIEQTSQQISHSEGQVKESLSNEEIERIKGLLGSLDKPSGACSLALSGKSPFSFSLNASEKISSEAWIIDSGATDHMTHTSHFFSTYTPCPAIEK